MAPDEATGQGAEISTLKKFLVCWLALAVLGWSIVNPVMSFREIITLQEELAAKSAVIESHERRLNAAEAALRQLKDQASGNVEPPPKPPEKQP